VIKALSARFGGNLRQKKTQPKGWVFLVFALTVQLHCWSVSIALLHCDGNSFTFDDGFVGNVIVVAEDQLQCVLAGA
jgi:hypothetical protein